MYETDYINIMNQTGMGAGQGAAAGGGWGALIGGGIGLMQGVAQEANNSINAENQLNQQNDLNAIQFDWMKQAMNFQSAKQFEMWLKTNYPAQVEQMKKAGLNPALIYKSAGGGGVTGNVSAGSIEGGKASDESSRAIAKNQAMGLTLQANMQNAQIENMKADTALKLATAEKTSGADTANVIAKTEETKANIANIAADTKNKEVQNAGMVIDNSIKSIEEEIAKGTKLLKIDTIKAQFDQILEKTREIGLNNDITEQSKDALIKKITMENLEILAKIANLKAQDVELAARANLHTAEELVKSKEAIKIEKETGITEEELRLFLTYGIPPKNWLSGVGSLMGKTTDSIDSNLIKPLLNLIFGN